MEWFVGIAIVLVLLIIFIMITPVEVLLQVKRKDKKQDIKAKITVWHFFYKTIQVPIIGFEEETASVVFKEKTNATGGKNDEKDVKATPEELKSQFEMLKMWLNHIDEMRPILKSMFRKIKITEFIWKSEIGTGDAAWTGFLTGMIWSVKSMAVGVASAVFKLKCSPEMDIKPHFQKPASDTAFSCMIYMRLGHAIIAGVRVMKHLNGNVFKLWQKTREETKSKEAS